MTLGACARGEEREYLGPADPTPVDRSIARVIVTPTIGSMQPDERIDFAAFGRNNSGDSISVEVSWTASGGHITTTGQFDSPIPGSYWVVARSNKQPDKADSAQVVVVGPSNPITRLVVAPKSLAMKVGQTRLITAAAFYGDGSPAQVPIFWSASGGSIDPSGLYTADEPGDQIVVAVVGSGLTDTARVQVTDQVVLTSLELAPSDDTLSQGASLNYFVSAFWSDGSTNVPAIDFSTTGGVIDSTGHFTAAAPPGDYLVTAAARGGSAVSTARVRIRPEEIASISVTPPSIALTPGATQLFSAVGTTGNGRNVPVSVNWQATGGTITTGGVYTAGATAGTYRVVGTLSGTTIADTAIAVISAPSATLTTLTLSPGSVTLASGEKANFAVSATWSNGSTAAPSVTWSATGGTITNAGQYTAGGVPGSYRVIVTHAGSGKADTSAVTVTAAKLTGLVVSPATASVATGGNFQFSASATWSDGSTALPTMVWTATGGSINATGRYTAGTSTGTFRVIGRDAAATVADTSFITVTSPTPVLQAIAVSPGSTTIPARGTKQFYVSGTWTNGGTSAPAVNWSTSTGSITAAGLYTATDKSGTHMVIAKEKNGTLADTALVTVQPTLPQLIGIDLVPATGTLQPGGTLQFAAHGIWTLGGTGDPLVTYSATGGTMTAAGLYTAGSAAGTFRVIAIQVGGTLADTSFVTITNSTPVLTGLTVSPSGVSVPTNGGRQFAVTGTWSNGGSGAPSVTWSATGGTISSAGYYTAGGTTGSYRVIATQVGGTLADTATVSVTSAAATLTSLTVVPDSASLQAGLTFDFKVTGTWSDGSTTVPAVTWSTTGGGTISSAGRYLAGSTAGVYQVIATHQGGTLADTAQVRVLAPTVTAITLTPGSASIPTGGSQQFTASATWSDGVVRPVAVTFSATGGTVSVNGLYTAGNVAGTFLVIATCSCGKADSASVVLTGPGGTPTLTSLTISPTSVNLNPGGTRQFSVSASWSDGSTTLPPVTWSTNGGTVSSNGAYTAPQGLGTYRVIVQHQGGSLADTASVTVLSAPPPPTGGWHEPAGMTMLTNRNFTTKAMGTTDATGAQGWDPIEGKYGLFHAVSDGSAPLSAAGVLETYYPTNFTSGTAPGTAQIAWAKSKQIRRVYHRFAIKMDSLFFGNQSTTNKLFHLWIGGGNRVFYRAVGSGTSNLTFQIALQGSPDVRTRFPANMGSGQLLRNRWYTYEVEVIANTPGQPDGIIRVWTNGTLTHEYLDVEIRAANENIYFEQMQWSPTWGGGGANTPYGFSVWLDHSYISLQP